MKKYDGKSILIIGAGQLQVPAIETANEMGLKTIVTDYNESAPGMKIANYPIVISIRDVDGTVRIMKEFNKKVKIDGVITVGTDASMTVAAVANALGLPGIPFENAEAASNKYKMRERLAKHNVPIPKYFKCWSLEDLKDISKILPYPFVIKPVDNMGARGIMKIESEAMLEFAFQNAKKGSPSGELVVEEYMEGPELSIDSLVYKDEILINGVADRLIEREPYFIEIGHIMPTILPEEKVADALDVFKKGVRALGITLGAAKGDVKVTKDGAKIVEIAARLSGGFMSAYTYPYSSGVNLVKAGIELALGFPPSNLVPTKQCVSVERAILPQAGIIEKIEGIDEALNIPGVMNVFLRADVGDEIVIPKSNVEKPGNIIVVKNTRREAIETAEMALKAIKITTSKDKALSWNEITRRARERFNRACFVCKECDGVECRGKVPGVGGIGNGNAFVRNYRDIKNILIKTRAIHDVSNVEMESDFFGINLELPLLIAPITGADVNLGGNISELEYACSIIRGAKDSGVLGFVGDGAHSDQYKIGLEAIRKNGSYGGIILKPRAAQHEIIKRIEEAMENYVKFIGVDVDAINFITMTEMNQKVSAKTINDISELTALSNVPFVIKGVMCIDDAEAAIKAGAKAIIVSNHGGRITENHQSSISVLKEISAKVKGRVKIIFDGGVRTGEDIFKAIALGADFVMVGRPFSIAALGGGKDGVGFLVKQFKEQLKKIMILTGSKDIKSIHESMVICPEFKNFFSYDEERIFR